MHFFFLMYNDFSIEMCTLQTFLDGLSHSSCHMFSMHATFPGFCAVHHLFGHERYLAVSRRLWIGPRAAQHGTKACVRFASSVPCNRQGKSKYLELNYFHGSVQFQLQQLAFFFLCFSMRHSSKKRKKD